MGSLLLPSWEEIDRDGAEAVVRIEGYLAGVKGETAQTALAWFLLGHAYDAKGDLRRSEEAFRTCAEIAQRVNERPLALGARGNAAVQAARRGEVGAGAAELREVHGLARVSGCRSVAEHCYVNLLATWCMAHKPIHDLHLDTLTDEELRLTAERNRALSRLVHGGGAGDGFEGDDPHSVLARAIAVRLRGEGCSEPALSALAEQVEGTPMASKVWYEIGVARAVGGDRDGAEYALRRAMEIDEAWGDRFGASLCGHALANLRGEEGIEDQRVACEGLREVGAWGTFARAAQGLAASLAGSDPEGSAYWLGEAARARERFENVEVTLTGPQGSVLSEAAPAGEGVPAGATEGEMAGGKAPRVGDASELAFTVEPVHENALEAIIVPVEEENAPEPPPNQRGLRDRPSLRTRLSRGPAAAAAGTGAVTLIALFGAVLFYLL